MTACEFFNQRLVLCVARWLVLNDLAGGVASVALSAAHLSCDRTDFPFEAGFHAPPYPRVGQRAVVWWECVPFFVLRLEHSHLDDDGY